jgi:hypothetical protein
MWYKRHYLVPLHGVSTAVLPLLKFQPSYNKNILISTGHSVREIFDDGSRAEWTCVAGTLKNISNAVDINLHSKEAYISDCDLMIPSIIFLYSWGSADVSRIKYILYMEN